MAVSQRAAGRGPLNHRAVLSIAVPIMLSNVSTPLLGIVDTGVVGQVPEPTYIGAVALGALVFNFVFWAFGFLRMGTTGLTAQALGAGDPSEIRASLGRAAVIAVAVGAALIALQWPIREIAFFLIDGSPRVEELARSYYDIRIWAAPATLLNFALLGWFIGLGRARMALILQLVLNITNMALDVLFVLGLNLGVQGVGLGTLLAEMIAAGVGLAIAARHLRRVGGHWGWAQLRAGDRMRRTIAVNRDIMIRSAALIVAFAWFMAHSATQGDTILAANAVLMQFVTFAAFFLDGLAFAAEALIGKAVGASDRTGLSAAARLTTGWAAGVAAAACVVFAVAGEVIIDLLTVDESVRATARIYLPWAVVTPLVSVWAFQLDGIFVGATRTAEMRNAMLAALAIFLLAWWLLTPLQNHGLWAALCVLYAARAGTLAYYFPALVRSVPA